MKRNLVAVAVLVFATTAHAQIGCTKIGFEPGTPDPNKCFTIVQEAPAKPAPAKPTKPAPAVPAKPAPAAPRPLLIMVQDRTVYQGIAQAASLVTTTPARVGRAVVNVGVADYQGATAVGLTFTHRPTNALLLGAGVSFSSGGSHLTRVSVGFEF